MTDKRKQAINLIKELKRKKKKWREAQREGLSYTSDWSGKDVGKYQLEVDGVTYRHWHEASDPDGAIKALKHLFQIDESEVEIE